jgi:hypothetical protein
MSWCLHGYDDFGAPPQRLAVYERTWQGPTSDSPDGATLRHARAGSSPRGVSTPGRATGEGRLRPTNLTGYPA